MPNRFVWMRELLLIKGSYVDKNNKGLTKRRKSLSLLLVRLARFERATYGLEVRCSIQLSYRRLMNRVNKYHRACWMSIKIMG
jgi:hypothetical protein